MGLLPSSLTASPNLRSSISRAGTKLHIFLHPSDTIWRFPSDGKVYSWGLGLTCQLGLGKKPKSESATEPQKPPGAIESSPTPTQVSSQQLNGWKVRSASAGGQHCVLLAQKEGGA